MKVSTRFCAPGRRVLPACWVLVCLCVPARAEPPQPLANWVFPAGGQRGKTVEVTISGKELQGASGIRVSGSGVSGKVLQVVNPTTVQAALEIAPNAEPGQRDLRLVTPGGVTNRLRFFVGELPELNETESNTERTQAQKLDSLPVVVNGQILERDRDCYRFAAKSGQVLVIRLEGRRALPYLPETVPGFLDACLTLFDAGGKVVGSVDRFRFDPDPLLIYPVPQDGAYTLEVSDILYRGRADFVYRLSIGALPYLTHVFPLGAQRGTTAQVALFGVNLPAPSLSFPVPPDSPPLRPLLLPGVPNLNPLPFAAGDYPETGETEPNDAQAQANRVSVPVTINGRIQKPGDMDHFVFAAQANQVLVMEVFARRLDSPLDAHLSLRNAQGGLLAEADEYQDPLTPLVMHHADARLVYTFPAAGDYVLRIRDMEAAGGEEYAYRLAIAPPKPDFFLYTMPDNPRTGKGETAVISVKAIRLDGFAGEINLSVQDLPPGFAASDAVIPAGQDEAKLTITAAADAPLGPVAPSIMGTATPVKDPVTRKALGAEDVMQAFSYHHTVFTQEFLLAVIEPAGLALSVGLAPKQVLEVKQGSEVPVTVKAVRRAPATGAVELSAIAMPAGITIKPATIPADKDETQVMLVIPKQAPVGLRTNILLSGTLKTDKETFTRNAPAIPIKILPEK